MPAMRSKDLVGVLETAALLAAVRTWSDMAETAMPTVTGLVRADGSVYHLLDLPSSLQADIFYPEQIYDPVAFEGYPHVVGSHPFVLGAQALVQSGVLRLADVTTRLAWHSSPAYGQVLRHLGMDDQMACVLEQSGGMPTVALTCFRRGRAFSARDRDVLALLRPHLVAAFGRLRASGSACAAVQVAPRARIVQVPSWPTTPLPPLLTEREDEVMLLLAAGRTSSQAARMLDCGPRTVEKHIQNIHRKLGATNRVDALARWQDAPTGSECRPT